MVVMKLLTLNVKIALLVEQTKHRQTGLVRAMTLLMDTA